MKTLSISSYTSALVAALGLFCSSPTSATIVTFDSLPGINGDVFSSYTESGITVAKLSGSGCVAKAYGSPIPDVFLGTICDNTSSGSYQIFGTGLLALNSIDFSANDGTGNLGPLFYQIRGYLSGISVWDMNSTLATTTGFVTISGFDATAVNYIQMEFIVGGTSANFDNINVSAAQSELPEPASLALFGLALAGLGFMRRPHPLNR